MSLLSDNVIPENHGKYFEINATAHKDIITIYHRMAYIK